MSDNSHLIGRFGEPEGPCADGAEHDHWGGEPVPAHVRTMHEVWAGEYVRRLRSDDPGQAIAYLHHLRRETEDVNPWRLMEQIAARAFPRKDG